MSASSFLFELVTDPDAGVRKVARKCVPDKPSAKLAEKLRAVQAETEAVAEAPPPELVPLVTGGLMPGETAEETRGGAAMPGEQSSANKAPTPHGLVEDQRNTCVISCSPR